MRAAPVLLAAALAVPAVALGQGVGLPGSGLWIGARGGYGVPFGDVSRGGRAVGDVAVRKFPISLDVGYRFNPTVWGELFIELAPASPSSCPPGVDCSAYDVRFGLEAQFHAARHGALEPWAGVGFGVEMLSADVWDPSLNGAWNWRWAGIEFPLLEGGVDVAVSRRVSVGPFATLSFATFTSASQRPPGGPRINGAVEERAEHAWAGVGLRAVLRL